jgi:DNA-directed RNA polymerase specialized sigma24 family protein
LEYGWEAEGLSMMSESAKRLDFEDKVLPYLEGMLQRSLSLTKNGRSAVRLMREALADAYQSWDGIVLDADCEIWLHEVLTRRFSSAFQRESRSCVPQKGDRPDENAVQTIRLSRAAATNDRGQSPLFRESDEDTAYVEAVAGLPAVLRSAGILSYLEGFPNEEIADLAGVRPQSIAALLNRGRRLMREELFAYLLGGGFGTSASTASKKERRRDRCRK